MWFRMEVVLVVAKPQASHLCSMLARCHKDVTERDEIPIRRPNCADKHRTVDNNALSMAHDMTGAELGNRCDSWGMCRGKNTGASDTDRATLLWRPGSAAAMLTAATMRGTQHCRTMLTSEATAQSRRASSWCWGCIPVRGAEAQCRSHLENFNWLLASVLDVCRSWAVFVPSCALLLHGPSPRAHWQRRAVHAQRQLLLCRPSPAEGHAIRLRLLLENGRRVPTVGWSTTASSTLINHCGWGCASCLLSVSAALGVWPARGPQTLTGI